MLVNPTIAKPEALGLGAMAAALADQAATPGPWGELSFEDRLGLLVDREADARDSRRLATRLKAAKLRYPAAVEDIDFRSPRGLNRTSPNRRRETTREPSRSLCAEGGDHRPHRSLNVIGAAPTVSAISRNGCPISAGLHNWNWKAGLRQTSRCTCSLQCRRDHGQDLLEGLVVDLRVGDVEP